MCASKLLLPAGADPSSGVIHDRPEVRRIEIPYSPRVLQNELHQARTRFLVLVCHRRFGKTIWAINELVKSAFSCRHQDPRVAYIGPQLKQAKRIAWDYLLRFTKNLPDRYVNRAELLVEWPVGEDSVARFYLLGADDPDSLRGAYLDDAALDEYEKMNPRTWTEVIRPMLADRLGGAVFTGTPYGTNHFHALWESAPTAGADWSRFMFKASETGIIPKAELASARSVMSQGQYDQEFECSWTAAIPGAYYAQLMDNADREGRITKVTRDPNYPVEAWFDLGVAANATAVWVVQRLKMETRVLHAIDLGGVGIPDIISIVRNLPHQPITRWVAPHDIETRDLSAAGAPKRSEVAQNYGVFFETAPKLPVAEGIDMVTRFLPTCVFDRDNTKDGRNALASYRSKYDGKNDVLKLVPQHDWASHFADAFRTGVQAGPGAGALIDGIDWSKFFKQCGGFAA